MYVKKTHVEMDHILCEEKRAKGGVWGSVSQGEEYVV